MENQTEIKWYQKPTGVIILIIFCFPIGLYLMWKNELWTKQTRWIVTISAVLALANAGKNNDASSSSSSSSSNSSSYKSKVKCGWCGTSFDKGTGYNTLMHMINQPDTDYSKYCSRKCAQDFCKRN